MALLHDEQFSDISFYIVAHADDWQLFMCPNVYNDLVNPERKVVFIITTAGDAGIGEKYWRAREEGLKSSVRFCLAPVTILSEPAGTRELNSHTITFWSANNVTSYFLRLPDGNLDGNGFSSTHYQSLSKFRTGQIPALFTLDGSTTYKDWEDFYSTLQAIILYESSSIPNIGIYYLNPDTNANPRDHTDHIATGLALQDMPIITHLPQALFVGYSVSSNSVNLQPNDLFWKVGMFAAYEKAVYDESGYSTLQEGIQTYRNWCLSSAKYEVIPRSS